MALGASALKALEPIANRLASSEWLQDLDPELASDLRRECGRREVSGRDMFLEAERLLREPVDDSASINLSDDLDSTITECFENLAAHSAAIVQEIREVDAEIQRVQDAIEEEKNKESPDEDKITALEEQLKKAEERKRDLEKDDDFALALKLLLGLAGMVSGTIGLVASGGSCAPCAAEALAGAHTVAQTLQEMGEDPGSVVDTVPASRDGINPDARPTDAEIAETKALIETDPNLDYIAPDTPGGNFLIARDKTTSDIVIVQIKELSRVTIKAAELELAQVVEGVETAQQLDAASWTSVRSLDVQKHSVQVRLSGTLNGREIEASFDQNPVDRPFVATVELK